MMLNYIESLFQSISRLYYLVNNLHNYSLFIYNSHFHLDYSYSYLIILKIIDKKLISHIVFCIYEQHIFNDMG